MKIAICSKNKGLKSELSDRFGRAENFVIFNTETNEIITIENTARTEPSGAGGSAVRLLAKNKVDVVIVPELGPHAMSAVKAFEMKVYSYGNCTTVEEAINKYKNGELKELSTNTNNGHHGLYRA